MSETDPVEGEFKEQETGLALREQQAIGLVREPDLVLAEATKAADALTRVIQSKPRKVQFGGKQYLELEDWVLLAEFYGVAPKTEWSRIIEVGEAKGWEARVVIIDKRTGMEVGAAESMCLDNERNWKGKDTFSIRSMAQTRATVKALSARLRWIPVLAGYAGTPAEEMTPTAGPNTQSEDPPHIDEATLALLEAEVMHKPERLAKAKPWIKAHGFLHPKMMYQRITNEQALELLELVGWEFGAA